MHSLYHEIPMKVINEVIWLVVPPKPFSSVMSDQGWSTTPGLQFLLLTLSVDVSQCYWHLCNMIEARQAEQTSMLWHSFVPFQQNLFLIFSLPAWPYIL